MNDSNDDNDNGNWQKEETVADRDANRKKPFKLSLESSEDFNAKLQKRGVLYIARIPPRMGPSKVKTLLTEFGVVTRVYLEEEDKAARKRRQRATGSKSGGKRYKEGWVEYEDKKVAKRVAESLNNTPITNHKRSVHYGDLWNLKYLPKFKWDHLTEKIGYERRVREQKLRIEMIHARRENQAYSDLVEAGKVMDRIEERRKKRKTKSDTDDDDDGNRTRKFKQNKPVEDQNDLPAKKAVLGALV